MLLQEQLQAKLQSKLQQQQQQQQQKSALDATPVTAPTTPVDAPPAFVRRTSHLPPLGNAYVSVHTAAATVAMLRQSRYASMDNVVHTLP
jgi:hypothetical protein